MTVFQRFLAKVKIDPATECWEWQGGKREGYGKFWMNGDSIPATRASWYFVHGMPSVGIFLCHHCDNPACVNPSHLFLGTTKDNMEDAAHKGRMRSNKGQRRAKLSESEVVEILRSGQIGRRALALKYGVDPKTISLIKSRRIWKHVNLS